MLLVEPVKTAPTKKRRRGCLRLLLYLFVFSFVAPIITFLIWTTWNGYQVNQMVKEIRARGEPVTLADLENAIRVPDGEQDATAIWRRGFEPLTTDEYKQSAKDIPFIGKLEEQDLPHLGSPWEGLEVADAFLAKHQSSLDAFHEAAKLGGYAAFQPNYRDGVLLAFDSWKAMRRSTQLLRVEFEVHAHRGETRKAAIALDALLKVSKALDNQSTIDIQLTAIACDRIALGALRETLFQLDFTPEELAGFQKIFREKKPIEAMKTALIGERAIHFSMLSDRNLIEPKPAFSPFNSDRAHLLKYMDRHIKAMEMGFPACFEEEMRIEQELIQFSGYAQYAPIFWIYSHNVVQLAGPSDRATADRMVYLAVADLGIAVELYRRKHDRLPNSLQDLVPDFIEKLPDDPFGNADFVFRPTANGFKIYSIGTPPIDNGGNFFNGRMRDWDIGLEFLVTKSPEPAEKNIPEQ